MAVRVAIRHRARHERASSMWPRRSSGPATWRMLNAGRRWQAKADLSANLESRMGVRFAEPSAERNAEFVKCAKRPPHRRDKPASGLQFANRPWRGADFDHTKPFCAMSGAVRKAAIVLRLEDLQGVVIDEQRTMRGAHRSESGAGGTQSPLEYRCDGPRLLHLCRVHDVKSLPPLDEQARNKFRSPGVVALQHNDQVAVRDLKPCCNGGIATEAPCESHDAYAFHLGPRAHGIGIGVRAAVVHDDQLPALNQRTDVIEQWENVAPERLRRPLPGQDAGEGRFEFANRVA